MVSLVQSDHPQVDLDVLRARKTRIARAYVDGGLTEAEYSDRLQEIDDQLQALETPVDHELGSAAELFQSVGTLWDEATSDERQRLVAPLLDRVYIDIETKQISAIVPAPAFKPLLDSAVDRSPDAKCVIIGPEEGSQTERGSVWWRRGRVELPVQRGFREGVYERIR